MLADQQDVWTFRIVDQATGAAVPGVPVTLLDDVGSPAGYWVSDADGIVMIPRHEHPRLRLRVGLRSEDPIELDPRTLHGAPIPLAAPQRVLPVAAENSAKREASLAAPGRVPAQHESGVQVLRFVRVGVFPSDADATMAPAHRAGSADHADQPAPVRYGVLLEVEQHWQSLGSQSGDLLYTVSLAPGDEVHVTVLDGRWRRRPDLRERPLRIVARMIGASTLGDGLDAVPLQALVLTDLQTAVAETVRLLSQRTLRMSEALRRRPLGVTELQGETPAGASIRTLRNTRLDHVVTYDFFEPIERYRVIVRTPRVRPALLVPFRLPNLATRDAVRQFGHVLRRALLDRALLPDVERLLASDDDRPDAAEKRVFAHIAANLPYYSATFIAAGDPGARFLALAKLRDGAGRVLTDVIENTVVGRLGNYVAFPLHSAEFAPADWNAALASYSARPQRFSDEVVVAVPIPGMWLRAQLAVPIQESARADAAAGEPAEEHEGRDRLGRGGRRPGRRG